MSLILNGDGSVQGVSSIAPTGQVTLPSTTSIGNVSSTEIGYLDGVTGAIQSQISSKDTFQKAFFSATASGNVWCRFAYVEGRQPIRLTVTTTGGQYAPGFVSLIFQRSWDNTSTNVANIVKGGVQYATQIRMQANSGDSNCYLELLFSVNAAQLNECFISRIETITGEPSINILQSYGTSLANLTYTSTAVTL